MPAIAEESIAIQSLPAQPCSARRVSASCYRATKAARSFREREVRRRRRAAGSERGADQGTDCRSDAKSARAGESSESRLPANPRRQRFRPAAGEPLCGTGRRLDSDRDPAGSRIRILSADPARFSGAETIDLAKAESVRMPAPGIWSRRDVEYRIPKPVLECDRLFSIAPLRIENGRPSLAIDNYRASRRSEAGAQTPTCRPSICSAFIRRIMR